MLNIPQDLLGRLVAVLDERGVPPAQHNYYKKWLRYYLDFCDKYRVEAASPKSQAQFLDKLREKKQTDWQIKQAAHAVSLYWDVQRALKARHYSPKTLKSYNHWARKLQSFKKDREPSSLTSEDVKEFLTYLAVPVPGLRFIAEPGIQCASLLLPARAGEGLRQDKGCGAGFDCSSA